jgi:hypothetical protein
VLHLKAREEGKFSVGMNHNARQQEQGVAAGATGTDGVIALWFLGGIQRLYRRRML